LTAGGQISLGLLCIDLLALTNMGPGEKPTAFKLIEREMAAIPCGGRSRSGPADSRVAPARSEASIRSGMIRAFRNWLRKKNRDPKRDLDISQRQNILPLIHDGT